MATWSREQGRLSMHIGGASYIRVPTIVLPPDKDKGN